MADHGEIGLRGKGIQPFEYYMRVIVGLQTGDLDSCRIERQAGGEAIRSFSGSGEGTVPELRREEGTVAGEEAHQPGTLVDTVQAQGAKRVFFLGYGVGVANEKEHDYSSEGMGGGEGPSRRGAASRSVRMTFSKVLRVNGLDREACDPADSHGFCVATSRSLVVSSRNSGFSEASAVIKRSPSGS